MQIGQKVYWVSHYDHICSGEVVAINATRLDQNGRPHLIVVDYDGQFIVRNRDQQWDDWFDSPAEAYLAGVERINKRMLSCTQGMSQLMADTARLTNEVEKKDRPT